MWRVIVFIGIYGFLIGFVCAQIVHRIRNHAGVGWSSEIVFRPKKAFVWLESGMTKTLLAALALGSIIIGWCKGDERFWGGGTFLLSIALTYWFCIKRRAVSFW